MNPVYLIYFLLTVIGLIILWAYVRCFFKRLVVLVKVKALCRKHDFCFTAHHPLWFLGCRYLKGADFSLETDNTVFSVKLFGCLWPLKSLILREHGEYIFRAHSNFLKAILDIYDGYQHPLPRYHFPEAGEKPQRKLLLICPMPLEILMQPSNSQEGISGTGDMICGMEIANIDHLRRIAENAK
jgi:hypothetical protein